MRSKQLTFQVCFEKQRARKTMLLFALIGVAAAHLCLLNPIQRGTVSEAVNKPGKCACRRQDILGRRWSRVCATSGSRVWPYTRTMWWYEWRSCWYSNSSGHPSKDCVLTYGFEFSVPKSTCSAQTPESGSFRMFQTPDIHQNYFFSSLSRFKRIWITFTLRIRVTSLSIGRRAWIRPRANFVNWHLCQTATQRLVSSICNRTSTLLLFLFATIHMWSASFEMLKIDHSLSFPVHRKVTEGTLRVRYFTNNPSAPAVFYQCANIAIY